MNTLYICLCLLTPFIYYFTHVKHTVYSLFISFQPTIHTTQTFIHLIRASVSVYVCTHIFLWQLNCVCTKLFTYLHFPFVFVSHFFFIFFFSFILIVYALVIFVFILFDFVYSSHEWKCLVAVFTMATQQLKFITIYNSFHFISLFFHFFRFLSEKVKENLVLQCNSMCVFHFYVSLFANGHEIQQT